MTLKKLAGIVLLIALAFFSFLMLRLSLPYTAMRSDVDFLRTKQNFYHITSWRWSFYIHVFTSIVVLVAGLTQFSPWILRRYPVVHRAMGWAYLVTVVLISGPAAWVMGLYANGGLPARASFVLLATLWIGFTFMAGWMAIKRRFVVHGAFMFRSYALTLSAITLRLYTFFSVFLPLQATPREIYVTTAWLSWVPNLLIAEMLIHAGWVKKVRR